MNIGTDRDNWTDDDWFEYEKGKHHYEDGWCRCTCVDCSPMGCSHVSNPATCKAHPILGK